MTTTTLMMYLLISNRADHFFQNVDLRFPTAIETADHTTKKCISIQLKLKNCLLKKILVRCIELPDKSRVSEIGEE